MEALKIGWELNKLDCRLKYFLLVDFFILVFVRDYRLEYAF